MHILIVTDAFPPNCGGSGWSTYELARGLRALGHALWIVQPRPGRSAHADREYDGFTIRERAARAPDIPYVRNYFKNERLWRHLEPFLAQIIDEARIDVVHAQHVLSGPPAIAAARRHRVPVVCTIRDYWPVCYWSTLIDDPDADALCPECSVSMMTRCVRPRAGALWPVALPLIPYMRRNLASKRQSLANASAVLAVSSTIARDLRARAPELAGTRIETIPNAVDVGGLQHVRTTTARPLDAPYTVYLGKLEPNKGALKLVAALARSHSRQPLVIVGDGSERARMEQAFSVARHDVRFTGWLGRDAALRWLSHASMLVFPSHGPESLSRVLLEAGAMGIPVAAMDTGGTRDIIEHDVTGLLSTTPDGLGEQMARLEADATLATRLASNARHRIMTTFDAAVVVARTDRLYRELIGER